MCRIEYCIQCEFADYSTANELIQRLYIRRMCQNATKYQTFNKIHSETPIS